MEFIGKRKNGLWEPREGQQVLVFNDKLWVFGGVNYEKIKPSMISGQVQTGLIGPKKEKLCGHPDGTTVWQFLMENIFNRRNGFERQCF